MDKEAGNTIRILYVQAEAELAAYIFAANPYKAGRPPKDHWKKYPFSGVVEFSAAADASEPYSLDVSGAEIHEKPGDWKFKTAEHYVERAVRIPYVYYRPIAGNEKFGLLVRDYFLIGFEGGMGY